MQHVNELTVKLTERHRMVQDAFHRWNQLDMVGTVSRHYMCGQLTMYMDVRNVRMDWLDETVDEKRFWVEPENRWQKEVTGKLITFTLE
jgi:hypothetical protein